MNTTPQTKKHPNKSNVAVSLRTREEIFRIVNSMNAEEHRGRLVKADDVVSVALTRLTSADMKKILDATLTNEDRLELKYKKFCETNGPISKDEFLGKLLGKSLYDDEI